MAMSMAAKISDSPSLDEFKIRGIFAENAFRQPRFQDRISFFFLERRNSPLQKIYQVKISVCGQNVD